MSVGPAFARTGRHYFPDFHAWLDPVPDPRCQEQITYHRRCLLWYGVRLCVGKLSSRRQLDFTYREPGTCVLDNLNRLAQTEQDTLPCNDTLDDDLALIGTGPITAWRAGMMDRLSRLRALDAARVQGRLVRGLDGSGALVFRWQQGAHGLTRPCGDHTRYGHQVLEAKLLGPAETVRSLGTAVLDNRVWADRPAPAGEPKRKQDGELKAARRLLQGVRQEFPQLRLCLTWDALYACGAGFALGQDFHVSFVSVFKEGSIPTWWQEFQVLGDLGPRQRLEVTADGWRHVYRWVEEWPDTDSDQRHWQLQAIHSRGEGPNGERSAWAGLVSADLVVSAATVEKMVWGAGRPRGREENQGFNVQKTSGLNREHASSEGEHFGAEELLLQLAHILLPLLEKGRRLRALARAWGKRSAVALLGSLKNIAEFLVESLRNLVWPAAVFGAQGPIQIRRDSS